MVDGDTGLFARSPERLRPLVEVFVPAAAGMDAVALQHMLRISDRTIAGRPAAVRRQIGLALTVLRWLMVVRFLGDPARAPLARRRAFLERLQDAPVRQLRLAVWGVRTLIFAGFYGDVDRHRDFGYHPDPRGWGALEGDHEAL